MKKAKLTFLGAIQDQEYDPESEYAEARIFFQMEIQGNRFDNLYCHFKKLMGSKFGEMLEIGMPIGASYEGPFNYAVYRDAVESFYAEWLNGLKSSAAEPEDKVGTFVERAKVVEFEVHGPDVSW